MPLLLNQFASKPSDPITLGKDELLCGWQYQRAYGQVDPVAMLTILGATTSPVPIPATLPLLGGGLASFGAIGWALAGAARADTITPTLLGAARSAYHDWIIVHEYRASANRAFSRTE